MTITLEVPDELGQQIEAAAAQQGADAQTFIVAAVQRALDPDAALDALLVSLGGEGEATYDDDDEVKEQEDEREDNAQF